MTRKHDHLPAIKRALERLQGHHTVADYSMAVDDLVEYLPWFISDYERLRRDECEFGDTVKG